MKNFVASVIAMAVVVMAFLISVVCHIAVGAVIVWIFNALTGANFGTVATGIVALVGWLRTKGELANALH